MIGSGPVPLGAGSGPATAGIEPMKPTTRRRRVCQVLLALALLALVIIQGLLEINPNH